MNELLNTNDQAVKKILDESSTILVIQSDRPDGDSISTSLFVESVLEEQNKKVILYCAVVVPEYLRFIDGWDRITNELPKRVDATILVDNAALVLLEKFENDPDSLFIKTKPFIIADHHTQVSSDIHYATHNISRDDFASAGELLYEIFSEYKYDISINAKKYVMQSILSDTLGLTNDLATPRTYRLMADFLESGIERTELEEARKKFSKMDERVFRYKAKLIERSKLLLNNQLAICVIPESESYDIGTLYNPGPLILSELLMIKDVKVAIALKTYHNRATAAIRCTHGTDIAHALASEYGGGGHPYSAGFRIDNYAGDLDKLISDITISVNKLIK